MCQQLLKERVVNKEVRELCKALRKQGFEIDEGGRHLKASRPGKPGKVIIPRTPSDGRGLKNAISVLRREHAFEWKGR